MTAARALLARPQGRAQLLAAYRHVRAATMKLIAPLSPEDMVAQSMADASPAKWHIAHTTWFFEELLLKSFCEGYRPTDARYGFLYNSYYNSLGERMARPKRGLATRPSVAEVVAYRGRVDEQVEAFLSSCGEEVLEAAAPILVLGFHHEQQHQELLLMDILHLFSFNPLFPVYQPVKPALVREAPGFSWLDYGGGDFELGADSEGFAYDNEGPRHRCWVAPFRLASRPVTNGEWLSFMEEGGYERHEWWLSDGWDAVRRHGWRAPLYWRREGGGWHEFGLGGLLPLEESAPVCHVSFYEADAYAKWKGARLPREAEWELAVSRERVREGGVNFLESGYLRPIAATAGEGLLQAEGDVWEWSGSAFLPYPGYRQAKGPLGEYNGKFMSGQMVARGGSCATPAGHMRLTYRNFFYPHMRWQFGGVRLADDG